MIPLLAIFMVGFAVLLGVMGTQQWQRGYRIAAGFSLITAAALIVIGVWILLLQLDVL